MKTTLNIPGTASLRACAGLLLIVGVLVLFLLGAGTTQHPKPVAQPRGSTLIQDGEPVPIEPKLAAFLERGRYHSVLLINEPGRIKWAGAGGQEVRICGRVVHGRVIGCGLNEPLKLENMTQITLFDYEKNPKCKLGNVDGDLAEVHKTNDPNGRWKKGQWDCHRAGRRAHR